MSPMGMDGPGSDYPTPRASTGSMDSATSANSTDSGMDDVRPESPLPDVGEPAPEERVVGVVDGAIDGAVDGAAAPPVASDKVPNTRNMMLLMAGISPDVVYKRDHSADLAEKLTWRPTSGQSTGEPLYIELEKAISMKILRPASAIFNIPDSVTGRIELLSAEGSPDANETMIMEDGISWDSGPIITRHTTHVQGEIKHDFFLSADHERHGRVYVKIATAVWSNQNKIMVISRMDKSVKFVPRHPVLDDYFEGIKGEKTTGLPATFQQYIEEKQLKAWDEIISATAEKKKKHRFRSD